MKTLFLSVLLAFAVVAQLPHPATLSPSTSPQSVAAWNSQGNALAVAAAGGVYFPGNNGTQGSIRTTLANGGTLTAIGTNAFTLWIRFRETTTDGACAFTLFEPGGGQSWIVLNMSTGRPYIEKGLAGSTQPNMVFDSLKGRLAGNLVDFVMVRSAGTITYYWNGVATTPTSGTDSSGTINLSSSAALWVGGGFSAAANFDSLINRAAMWNRALSAAEVLSLGTYGVARTDQWGTTASPGCILDLDLTKGSGTTVADRSGNLTPTTTGSFTHQLPRAVGSVSSVSVTTANGVSASVANPTTTPALSFTLGDITPTTVYLRGTDAVSNVLQMQYISETLPRFAVRKDGVILFGSGSAVPDANLYRSAANTLKTDTDFAANNITSATVTTTGAIQGGTGRFLTQYVTNAVTANSIILYSGTNTVTALLNGSGTRWQLNGGFNPDTTGTYSLGEGSYRWLSGVFSGTVTASKFTSEVATGTAPFTIASTTLNANLNADLLDGLDSAAFQPASGALTNLASAGTTGSGAVMLSASPTTTGTFTGSAGRFNTLYVTNAATANVLTLYSGASSVSAYLNGAGNRWTLTGGMDPSADATYSLGQGGVRWASGVFSGTVTAGTFSGSLAVGNVTGLGTGIATWLAAPSSANLAAALTDETGTGAAVFANSPTLVTPALGTPSSVNLANASNLPSSAIVATENTQTGTTYTLQASDNGKVVTLNNAGAITVTVPTLSAGFTCTLIQKGAGQVTFSASGTTVNNAHGQSKTFGQHAVVTLYGTSSTTFVLAGDTGT